jgi:hypothetical protein
MVSLPDAAQILDTTPEALQAMLPRQPVGDDEPGILLMAGLDGRPGVTFAYIKKRPDGGPPFFLKSSIY